MKFQGHLYQNEWPTWDEEKTIESTIEIAVQFNGKVKATVAIAPEEEEASVKEKVHANPAVVAALEGKTIVKEIYIKGKIYNIVVR